MSYLCSLFVGFDSSFVELDLSFRLHVFSSRFIAWKVVNSSELKSPRMSSAVVT